MALDNLDEILSVEGIDVCMIGPADLSFSLGIHGQFDHPKFNEALDHVLATCKKHDVAPGFFCTDENINDMIARGFQFFNLAGDFWFLTKGVKAALAAVNGWEPMPYNR
jgi:2-dehydro-3-deoxyglucarate aldolase/4-hydroxy-2-oxoheptanedioate aldolase